MFCKRKFMNVKKTDTLNISIKIDRFKISFIHERKKPLFYSAVKTIFIDSLFQFSNTKIKSAG